MGDWWAQLARQRAYGVSHGFPSVSERRAHLARLQAAIVAHEDAILTALAHDLGKPPDDAWVTEVGICLQEIRYHRRHLSTWAAPRRVPTPWGLFPFARSMVVTNPLGVVAIIGPWNYPFQLIMMPLIGALSAGNAVVIKPSELAPHTAAVIHTIVAACFLPEHVQVIMGGAEVTQRLLTERLDHVFFTGSTSVGRQIMRQASDTLTPVTLELGGKCPCLVDETVSVNWVAQRLAYGKFLNAGQTCIAPDYLLVPVAMKDAMIQALKAHITACFADEKGGFTRMGRVINRVHLDRLAGYLKGGIIHFGGQIQADSLLMSPTILEVTPDHPVMHDEVFGPLLPIIPYTHLEDAFRLMATHPHPLALYLFSQDASLQHRIITTQVAGGITINDTLCHVANPHLPFGGVGASGMGRYHGQASFLTFSAQKSVLIQSRWPSGYRYPPYSPWRMALIRWMMGGWGEWGRAILGWYRKRVTR